MAEGAQRAPFVPHAEWILTLNQTAGRGRRGRVWEMPAGNFAATLVLRLPELGIAAAQRSFVAALALETALRAVGTPETRLALKWPNDVLLDGRKLAGILLETAADAVLLVGIGVNLTAAPSPERLEPGALPPIALADLLAPPAPEAFLDHLAPAFARWDGVLRDQGFGPIRQAWLARAAGLGQMVTARLGQETLRGRFETLDDSGQIVLDTATGPRRIAAAEIFFD